MADRKSDFALPTLDELFSTQEERDDAKLEKIRDIPDHPFHVRDDEDMVQLVESVKTNGVLTPQTVEPLFSFLIYPSAFFTVRREAMTFSTAPRVSAVLCSIHEEIE